MNKQDSKDLMERLKNSDRGSFDEIYIKYYTLLVNYASLMVVRESAKDIVHDVFINFWKNREHIVINSDDEGNGIRNYLFRSTYNAAVSLIRKNLSSLNYRQWLTDKIETVCQSYDIDRSDIMQKFYSQDLSLKLNEAISRLPVKCREVFLLSYTEDLTNKEIAKKLGLSVYTVQNHIHNALTRLREALSDIEK